MTGVDPLRPSVNVLLYRMPVVAGDFPTGGTMMSGERRYSNRTGSPEFAASQEPDESVEAALTVRCVQELRLSAEFDNAWCLCGARIWIFDTEALTAHAETCRTLRREWEGVL
jgi:hypothetical protein